MPAPDQNAIFIVEDHAVMRESLRSLLELSPDLRVCGEADSGAVALERLDGTAPDLVLVDLSLPDMSGIELARTLRTRRPALTVAMLSGHSDPRYVEQALDAGADGYILKGLGAEVPVAVRRILAGERYVSPRLGLPPEPSG